MGDSALEEIRVTLSGMRTTQEEQAVFMARLDEKMETIIDRGCAKGEGYAKDLHARIDTQRNITGTVAALSAAIVSIWGYFKQ